MPEYLRPREKLEKLGPDKLSETELLAIVLGVGSKEENVIDLSFRILKDHDSDFLFNCDIHELMEIKGLGIAKAARLKACFELSKRLLHAQKQQLKVRSIEDAISVFRSLISEYEKEQLMMIIIDNGYNILSARVIASGSLQHLSIYPKELFKDAMKKGGKGILLAHNHPSGNCKPSIEDICFTRKVIKVGKIMDIELLDHIILTKSKVFSFKKERPEIFDE